MTSELINLNKVRKARAAAEAASKAADNRIKFGRSKAERDLERRRLEKAKADLDARKRDPSQSPPKP
jgi:hypothetical protein